MKNNIEIDGEVYDSETGELINEVEQVEVEMVDEALPSIVCNGGTHIQTNTEQLKRELIIYLKKYDVEVTEETEKECSKKATELNQLAGDLNAKRLKVAKEIKKPADRLKTSIDELISIVQEKRQNILDGVSVFKEKRFDRIRQLLEDRRDALYYEMKVSKPYQKVDVEPLVVEGSLANIALTKKANEAVEALVRKVKAVEDAVTIRELQLEILCKKAGMSVPIELKEVSHIIESDEYDIKLQEMITSRLEVEAKIIQQQKEAADRLSEAARVQEERAAQVQADCENRKSQEEAKKQEEEINAKIKQEKETGKKIVIVTATFEVEVGINVSEDKVIKQYEAEIKKHFRTLISVKQNDT